MDPNLRIAQQYRVEHRHSDGSWSPLEPMHHEAAAHDAERAWVRRTIYRCADCAEEVAVTEGPDEDGQPTR